jgi:two-component system response regulator
MLNKVADKRRGGKRSKMLKGGVIAFSGRHATMPCVVRDLSETGARLQVAQSNAVPDTFELLVELDGLEVLSRIVWRKSQEVGVEFLEIPRINTPKRVQIVGHTNPVARATLRRQPTAPAPHTPALATPEPVSVPARPQMPVLRTPKGAAAQPGSIPILIAEDDPDDRLLIQDAFKESAFEHPIVFVQNGEELLSYVRGEVPYEARRLPGLILLDLNMPRMDGRTALMHLKTDSHFKRIPVIVLTTSNTDDDIQRTYDLGVTAYISKPGSFDGLIQLVTSLNDFWMRYVSMPAA